MPDKAQADSWFDRVPKVELHLHLEGAIPLQALWTLVEKYGGHRDVPNPDALEAKFVFVDFPHFIQTWLWKNQFLREGEDFVFIAEAVARELKRQNIRYVEAFCSPLDFTGIGIQDLLAALRTGLDRVGGIEVALIPDLIRDCGPERGGILLEQLAEVRDLGLIGIGLGGSEQRFPPEPYAEVYDRARDLGFHTTAHAGEAAGPESIWGAARVLKAERIGHGTRAVEDEALMEYLASTRIPIECCPISNVRTRVVTDLESHPIRAFFERGLMVTINTDDPAMFNNSLADEYRALEEVHGFSRSEICRLIGNAVDVSWLSDERKQRLHADLAADPSWFTVDSGDRSGQWQE